ncbi:putative bifunctional diguanylate cyclase/phosphodiesterase [Marinimicrobium agarilyticum]|uniref:putative bifunctional diguanylate cyclase/phosphodiesterase n=1 Tax=Marinimicrobium agarilyticum TaxID=306546 RepID=UPI0003F90B8A|nr:bifunctional diguanylate cyclase/phosphodiesterase [Marinimicrobium agarilyticum]
MTPVRIALIYLSLASLWILLSDRLLFGWVAADSTSFLFWQTAKGWLFVGASSVIIYFLAERLNRALARQLEMKRRHLNVLRRKAYTDYLTGLPNRRFGLRTARRMIRRAEERGSGFGMILLDVDDFKRINDNLDQNAGDDLIVAVALRLQRQLQTGEHLIRQGGDEFMLLCAGIEGRHRIGQRVSAFLDSLAEPFELQGMELNISASAGIACYPEDGGQLSELTRNADLALHQSKRYKNCFNFYQPAFAETLLHRFDLQQRLSDALESEALTVYFQPIYDTVLRRCTGAEALVRWPTEDGFIPPSEFIPVAEQTGQIRAVGIFVLNRAFTHTVALMKTLDVSLTISVNVSPKHFVEGRIVRDVEQALASTGIDPRCVILEITEGVLLNNVHDVSEWLHRLIALGVSISMDDFGQGYSSLSYLRDHPFRYLKIDRSFIQTMERSPKDRALVEASFRMARALELKVVAEGVETEGQQTALRDIGVDYLQGFLLSRPLPADDYQALLQTEYRKA